MTDTAAGVVKLRYGSLINLEDLGQLNDEMTEVFEERDRARRLAAKLEEVVAMRNTVLGAIIAAWHKDAGEPTMEVCIEWAVAQLSEIP